MTEYRTFGPPGTGKTTWLSGQIARAVERRGPGGVLVASFTKAAAVELAGRDLPIDQRNLGTLHALCYRQLGSPTIAETKLSEFNKWQSLYRLSDGSIDIDEPEQRFETDADKLFADYQGFRARMIPQEVWPLQIKGFANHWERWKAVNNYIDFTDMISLTLDFQSPPPNAPEIGFFDEVQDFTLLELSLIRQWAQYLDFIVLAGDDDQCIYGFKGATPLAFLQPEIDDANKRVLSHSWRMPRVVHEFSQEWISRIVQREHKPFTPKDAEGNLHYRGELRFNQPDRIAEELAAISASEQTAMIIGSCSYMLTDIVSALRARGELFHNPYRRKRGDWNPLQASRTGTISTRDRLIALSRPHREIWGDEAEQWTYGDLRKFLPLMRKTGVIQRGQSKLVDLALGDAPVSAADLSSLLEPEAMMPVINGDLAWIQAHAASEKIKALEYPMQVVRMKGWKALLDRPRIVIGTIHSVKGGEADSVFLLPDVSRAGMTEYCDDRTRDGTIRQFYVGMTRARESLILCGQSSPNSVKW